MNRCAVGLRLVRGQYGRVNPRERCKNAAVAERLYCELHLAEAMMRVRTVTDGDKPRPWGNAVRASWLGTPYKGMANG